MAEQKTAEPQWKTTTFLVDKEEHVGILTYNAPEKLNAGTINPEHGPYWANDRDEKWWQAFQQVKLDPEINVVVVTGAGRAFSAGADLKQWGAGSKRALETGERRVSGTVVSEGTTKPHEWLYRLKKPTIAMVNGPAVGEGCDLALVCDMVVMAEEAFFQWAYILRGMLPMDGACWLLPRRVGRAKAMELLLTGDRVYGPEALRIGLANKVVPLEKLRETTMELANKIASGPKKAIQLTRFAIDAAESQSFRENLDLGSVCNMSTRDTIMKGTMTWGMEKKDAEFKGE